MLSLLLPGLNHEILSFFGMIAAFILTCLFLHSFMKYLPQDQGRAFAHDGAKSAGKPRGAGIIFILVFFFVRLLFGQFSAEYLIYELLVVASMLTGFFDDSAEHPWGGFKKGMLDFLIAVAAAVNYIYFNGTEIYFRTFDKTVTLHPFLYGLLIIVLVWTSINVTNCADGVDGLSGTLSCITLGTMFVLIQSQGKHTDFNYDILLFFVCIIAYLWFNANPSRLLMGDAGSRAMGMFIAVAALKTENPFVYILAAFVLLMDGGLGLLKVALLRFLKIRIFKKTRFPLHDHVRKNMNWSNTQCVMRFAIIQLVISLALVYGSFI